MTITIEDRCALYLMKDERSGSYKIGISKHPHQRRSQVQKKYDVGCVSLIETTWFVERSEAEYYERAFHERYAKRLNKNPGGREWFRLGKEDVANFLEWMERSSNKRAYEATTLVIETPRPTGDIIGGCIGRFLIGQMLGSVVGLIPALMLGAVVSAVAPSESKDRQGIILMIPSLVGGVLLAKRVERKNITKKTFGEDGKPLSPKVPAEELKLMKLWNETEVVLPEGTTEFPNSYKL